MRRRQVWQQGIAAAAILGFGQWRAAATLAAAPTHGAEQAASETAAPEAVSPTTATEADAPAEATAVSETPETGSEAPAPEAKKQHGKKGHQH